MKIGRQPNDKFRPYTVEIKVETPNDEDLVRAMIQFAEDSDQKYYTLKSGTVITRSAISTYLLAMLKHAITGGEE